MKSQNPIALLFAWLSLAAPPINAIRAADGAAANISDTGGVEGRVLNASSGDYLNNARITVKGTAIETRTNAIGEFKLANVPVGQVVVDVSFVGFGPQSAPVQITTGQMARQDFTLSLEGGSTRAQGNIVKLEAFTVEERQMSGQAVALQEQRNAPNIKNVISLSEFGDMGEGNVGEYIKFVPGLDIAYNPTNPTTVSIRGMPASGTLIMIDGALMASPGFAVSRSNDLSNASSANVDRIEITKTPTPDMPANAVGGSINMVTKSGFSRTKPLFTYNVFMAYNDSGGVEDPQLRFDRLDGPDDKSGFRRIQPAANLSYIWPLNKSLAFTFTANYASRYGTYEYQNTTWDQVRGVLATNATNIILSGIETKMFSTSVDWKATNDDIFRFSYQRSDVYKMIRQNRFPRALGAGATGSATFSQGASTGVGTIVKTYSAESQYLDMDMATVNYRHEGTEWKLAANLSFSKGDYVVKNTDDGFFTSVNESGLTNLVLRMDGLDGVYDRKVPVLTATDRSGSAVDPYRLNGAQTINSVSKSSPIRRQEILGGGIHVTREMPWSIPVAFKAGLALDRQKRNVSSDSYSWTFSPPGGAAARAISNYDIVATEFSRDWYSTDAAGTKVHPEFLSTAKVYNLYKQNPGWFVLNEAAAHQAAVTNRRQLEETITAGYLRADARFLENRLWLVGGVRYERTEDKGRGPLNDIAATFVRNADGSFARTPAGLKIPVTNDALERAKLQYKMLGATSGESYDGYYPSFNASFSLSDAVVLRAAYARTIGRPDLANIIPGVTITDPDAASMVRTINVVNSGLKPWTANNYDLTAELYSVKGATASISLFQKDLTAFFTESRADATRELVESYDVPWEDFYSGYELVTTRNGGTARLRGIELSYRQSLYFLPAWAKGFQVSGNITTMSLSGPDRENLQSFAPRNVNWGVSYSRSKFNVNINVALQKWIRTSAATTSATIPPGTYNYQKNSPRVDASFEYNFTKQFGVYGGVRNALAVPNARIRTNWSVPSYTHPSATQYNHALFTFGVKGSF